MTLLCGGLPSIYIFYVNVIFYVVEFHMYRPHPGNISLATPLVVVQTIRNILYEIKIAFVLPPIDYDYEWYYNARTEPSLTKISVVR